MPKPTPEAPAGPAAQRPPFLGDETIRAELLKTPVRCCVCGSDDAPVVARGYDYEYRSSRDEWVYKRCSECALVFLDPRPATEELGAIYPPTYYSYDEGKRGNPLVGFFRGRLESMKAKAFARAAGEGPKRVLDVGCGDGRFLSVLREHGPSDWILSGVDIDAGAVGRAQAKGLDVRTARLEELEPAAEERYDMVVLFQTIEHVSEPGAMCTKVAALLQPGGLFVIETPDVAGLDEKWFRNGLWGGYHIPRHWNLFNPSNLRRLLTESGFEIVETRPLISTSFWINSLYNRALVRGASERWLGFFNYQNPLLLGAFIGLDKLRMLFGARTSNMRVVARKRRATP